MYGISAVTQTVGTPRRFTCWTGREELKPSVQNLSGQLRPPTRSSSSSSDEDSNGYQVTYSQQAFLGERHNALTCRPFLSQRPSQRTTVNQKPDPIHRQTVHRSGQMRSRLSYTRSRSADHMLSQTGNQNTDNEYFGIQLARSMDRPNSLMYSHPSSRLSNPDRSTPPRPSTTHGRYFDPSNGLRGRNLLMNRRPQTAGSWLTAGLKIQRIKLHTKNEFSVKFDGR